MDALSLLSPGPGRSGRPKRIAVLLRGLPGSGKSHVARLIRDKEVAAGGEPPRILSLDDYFMTVGCLLWHQRTGPTAACGGVWVAMRRTPVAATTRLPPPLLLLLLSPLPLWLHP